MHTYANSTAPDGTSADHSRGTPQFLLGGVEALGHHPLALECEGADAGWDES